ncbi:MAG: Glu/Leu/Phe/Val dehydrogenase [Simkaniaceae bacterium]|nr:Glu/Leu/Phe/Val dehydrogenase [Simkaniaceae bacterium]
MSLTKKEIAVPGFEQVIKVTDKKSGLEAIIAIHSTVMGPALGGTRIHPYANFEDALTDVLRLSKGMTYKSALAETGLGGGKSVIIADPKTGKTKELLHAFAEAVNDLQGKYICAEDVGCSPEDMNTIREKTKYVTGSTLNGASGNPAPFTAWGTVRGIQAAMQFLYGSPSVQGKTVAIQGVGNVGQVLAEHLYWLGANLIIADADRAKAERVAHSLGAKVVAQEEILGVECDILSPCALGGIINSSTLPYIKAKVIAGCANNQLQEEYHGDFLHRRGILYVPDFVINAGGLINVLCELEEEGYRPTVARNRVNAIYDQLMTIFEMSKRNKQSTAVAANALAEYRLRYGIGKNKPLVIR